MEAGNQEKQDALSRLLAGICERCPVCRRARKRPDGLAARFVRAVGGRFCPACRAYARVHKRAAHQPPDAPSGG